MKSLDLLHSLTELIGCIREITIRQIYPNYRLVGRYLNHLGAIYAEQLLLRVRNRTAHTRHLGKQAEEVLKSNRCHRTVFLRSIYSFLYLNRLMQATAQFHSRHASP